MSKVQCRAYTTKGKRCSRLTENQREYKGSFYPCCKNHKEWWWLQAGPFRPRPAGKKKSMESPGNNTQQRKGKICRECDGTGKYYRFGSFKSSKCPYCSGVGRLSSVA